MKRCADCDRSYADDRLRFCTACGAALVADRPGAEPAHDPFKTRVAMPRPPVARANRVAEPAGFGQDFANVPIVNPSWAEIAPLVQQSADGEPSRGLALGAMVCGLVALLSCSLLSFVGPVAAILGFVALRKQQRDPLRYGGRGFAITGIVTGILAFLVMLGSLVGLGMVMSNSSWR